MSNQIFLLLSLLILTQSQYLRPMKKDSKYGDDVCSYIEEGYQYVKPCEKGKYCLEETSTGSDLYICQTLPEIQEGLNILNDKCSSDFECEYNLKCIGGVCSLKCSSTNYSPVKLLTGSYSCIDSSSDKAADGVCFLEEYDNSGNVKSTKYGNPTGKSQICGLYSNFYDRGNQNYVHSEIKYANIGSVDNGNYVSDEILCKSGFALYYYPKGNLQDPYTGTNTFSPNNMYKMCVTPVAIEHFDPLLSQQALSSCVIYYKEKDEDTTIKKYNVEQLLSRNMVSSPSSSSSPLSDFNKLCGYTDYEFKIKFQHFKEYTTNLKEEERDKCGDLRPYSTSNNYNYRRYSCDNNALIKSWYFYTNPEDYIVYNDREKLEVVLNYLIQKDNPSYEFSHILNINYLIYLLFLLFL